MNRFLSLVRVNVKMAFQRSGMGLNSKKKKKNSVFSKVLIAAFFVLLAILLVFMGWGMAKGYQEIGQFELFPQMVILTNFLMIVIVLFAFITSTLFYGEDTKVYLSMPIPPREIVGAKFVTLLLESYLMEAYMGIPMAIGGLIAVFDLRMLFMWIVLFPILPIIPVCIMAIFMLILLKLVPALRQEKLLSTLSGLLTICGAFSISFMMQMNGKMMNPNPMPMGLLEGSANSGFNLRSLLLPSTSIAQSVFFGGLRDVVVSLLFLVLVSAIWMAVASFVVSRTYLPILLSMRSEGKAKKLTNEQVRASSKGKSPFVALMQREIKSVMRSPVALLNGVLVPYFMIVVFVISSVMGLMQSNLSIGSIFTTARDFLQEMQQVTVTAMVMGLIAAVVISVISTMGSLISTTFTRDAHHFDFLKSIPVKPSTIIYAKTVGCTVFYAPSVLLLLVAALVFLPFHPVTFISMIVGLAFMLFGHAMFDLFLDIKSPKVDWIDETAAIKTNKNVLISMAASILIILVLVPLAGMGYLVESLIAYTLLCALAGIGIFLYVQKNAQKLIDNLGEKA